MTVYVLTGCNFMDEDKDTKITLGVFSSNEKAVEAAKKALDNGYFDLRANSFEIDSEKYVH